MSPPAPGESKQCGGCQRTLPRGEFHKATLSRDGLQWNCKSCQREVERRYRSRLRSYLQCVYMQARARGGAAPSQGSP
eukprot:tig00000492_g1515.t1